MPKHEMVKIQLYANKLIAASCSRTYGIHYSSDYFGLGIASLQIKILNSKELEF